MGNTVEIKYKVRKDFCRCCERRFEEKQVDEKTIEIDVDDFFNYAVGRDNEVYAEDMIRYVDDIYLHDVLNDFVSFGSYAYVEASESNKVLKKAYEIIKAINRVTIHQEQLLLDHLNS